MENEEVMAAPPLMKRTQPKTLHNSEASGCKKNVKDVIMTGAPDLFRLLSKASSEAEGWMKSTKAMQCPNGVVIQVTTQQKNHYDSSYSVAEALTFVPDVKITGEKGHFVLSLQDYKAIAVD